MTITKPTYASGWLDTYIAQATTPDLLAELENNLRTFTRFIAAIPAEKLDYRYAEGKWSIKEIVSHLTDSERVFSYRALRFARNDKTELPGYDEGLYAQFTNASRREIKSLLAEFEAVRHSTQSLYTSFEEDMLDRQGIANGIGLTPRALGFAIVGHGIHHSRIITERYLS